MDPTSWSAYSQHFSRLGASMNHPQLPTQGGPMNELRQEHLPGYGNPSGHFLLPHGLNPSQPNHNDPSFNANLFNYDASLFSSSFPAANKGHLGSFPQGMFKAVNRENDFNDLRTGFSHCGMAYGRNSEGNNGLSGPSGHLFPNSMPPGSWRHSGMMPSSCGPFGVLPHETVLQRSHLMGRTAEKLQASKQSRSSHPSSSFVEQDLGRGYRTVLSSPARPPSSYVDSSNTSHSSLLSPQSDPYFSSVSDNYYSSCSKNDFAAYSSYCSNVQSGVQRGYCYPQSFGSFEPNEKQEVPTTSTNTSANANFTNFVPNSSLNGNPASHHHNDQISRQSVITSNINNNAAMFNPESHPPQNHSYNMREAYPYPPGAAHANSGIPVHPTNNRSETNGSRQALQHINNSHHSSTGQNLYPPINTPIPASTPAHTTPPSSSMGQAYVPTPLPMSHDSGCSSVNSQSVMYHSPSNDGCYSTPGTCPSESGSPAKQDLSQHSSPSVYSIDSSNLSMNSASFAEQHRARSRSGSEVNYSGANGGLASDHQDSTNDSTKAIEKNHRDVGPALVVSDCRPQQPKDAHLPQVLPIDMVKLNKECVYQNATDARFEGRPANLPIQVPSHPKHVDPLTPSRPECAIKVKGESFPFSSQSPSPALDFTAKDKPNRKRKCEESASSSPLNCTYSHLQSSESHQTSPGSTTDREEGRTPLSHASVRECLSTSATTSELHSVGNSSPLPVDLSHSVKVAIDEPDSPPEKKEMKESLPNLNYETDKSTGGKWSLTKQDSKDNDKKVPVSADIPENLTTQSNPEKEDTKRRSPLCRTPPMDDLSDESKKLCNSIEEDLGFLAGLSSDPDVEDSVSKGSYSEKKGKKEKGFLQSFLTFLESSNEPSVSAAAASLEAVKEEKKDNMESSPKLEVKEKKEDSPQVEDPKSDGDKTIIEDDQEDSKDNFDEAPSLDPTLFACSTLQKEMVVPNPEAPSFSSDEDENSNQGISNSVAMAIQRLQDDHDDDQGKQSSNSKSKKEMPVLTSMAESPTKDEEMPSLDGNPIEECTIKRCVMRGRRGKRRKRHLLVIKVKRPADIPAEPSNPSVTPVKKTRKKRTPKNLEIIKGLPNSQRRTPMRKCREKNVGKKNARKARRKSRNSIKRKHEALEKEGTVDIIIYEDDVNKVSNVQEMEKDEPTGPPPLTISIPPIKPKLTETSQTPSLETPATPAKPIQPPAPLHSSKPNSLPVAKSPVRPTPPKKKKPSTTIGYRTRKRRRKPRKPPVELIPMETATVPEIYDQPSAPTEVKTVADPDPPKPAEEPVTPIVVTPPAENDVQSKHSVGEGCWSTETHFKTGDFVISVDSKDSEFPPMWRIEGKNVLQLFEVLENKDGSSSILYRNTSSYSRWSPSSKHKYLKRPVKIIKSDDDTVIVEIMQNSESVADKDISSSCDYTVHPQRENFEVYLQTLVSHSLDPDFIPEIVKEKDEYFLSHLQVIEEITSLKKKELHQKERWSAQLCNTLDTYPHLSVSKSTNEEESLCQVCQGNKIQCVVHFQGPVYDPLTLVSQDDVKIPACDLNFPLCGLCSQVVTLYSRLHHHRYHFFQLGCKKVRDVKKGGGKDSHTVLEECLQDAEWMTRMFQEMLEMWTVCDKYSNNACEKEPLQDDTVPASSCIPKTVEYLGEITIAELLFLLELCLF
ncbi:hypothetical protein JTE90_018023 [Oedothorax gibbosus]|uniref:DUF4211 domain-containing protein n=1 Tax=Oedothorax gibbosus TaxID=931172 RepID=A0AAV6V979_9ARAC|nr:hypothetical protein JTE90_018023 [Oedothorax gibbosus]